MNILIADDDPVLRTVLEEMMRDFCPREALTVCSSGDEAIHKLQSVAQFDVVLSDYHMGKGRATGVDVLAEIEKRGLSVRFVLMTGEATKVLSYHPDIKQRCTLLSKPFETDDMLQALGIEGI